NTFADRIYKTIEENWKYLPVKSQYLFPYMKNGNWLLRYASTEGIGQSLTGMSKRINHDSKLDEAIHELHQFYDTFKLEFQQFIIEIKSHFDPGN
ncbi:MAG: acyl carrier protein phosphodiesterase, partial [Cyclobacteriaceae bacterium]|nr:acyl carrier protein phosphodiesterase [Cyclobacteriaceae bacterium]